MSNKFLLTTEQAALELDCSTSTINRLVKQKQLIKVYLTPGSKRGGCPRITRNSVKRYLESLCERPYSSQCTGASATKRGSVWQQSIKERTRHITGAAGSGQMAQELGEKLGVLPPRKAQ